MKLSYSLEPSDFLAYHLYSNSRSTLQKNRRLRVHLMVLIFYIGLALFAYFIQQSLNTAFIFSLLAMLWFVLYPLYTKWKYKKYYQKHIKENYAYHINVPIEITFTDNEVLTKDHSSESKIKGSELHKLIETQQHYFVKLRTNHALIMPKTVVVDHAHFKKSLGDLGALYVDDTNWRWK